MNGDGELHDLPASGFSGDGYGGIVIEELMASAARAKSRARELRERTARVMAESREVARLAQTGELGLSRVQQLLEEVEGLSRTMQTRAVIEQAKGMLMFSLGCGPDEAFERLVERSEVEDRTVVEVATELVDRGTGRTG